MIIETIYVELTPSNATARVYVNGEPLFTDTHTRMSLCLECIGAVWQWNAIVVDEETDTDWTVVIEDEE